MRVQTLRGEAGTSAAELIDTAVGRGFTPAAAIPRRLHRRGRRKHLIHRRSDGPPSPEGKAWGRAPTNHWRFVQILVRRTCGAGGGRMWASAPTTVHSGFSHRRGRCPHRPAPGRLRAGEWIRANPIRRTLHPIFHQTERRILLWKQKYVQNVVENYLLTSLIGEINLKALVELIVKNVILVL